MYTSKRPRSKPGMILVSSISGVPINLACGNLFIGCTGKRCVAALIYP